MNRLFADDLHAKRILSLANGALGVMTSRALAVSLVGQALAQARGILPKLGIKQVDRLLSNVGVVPWDLFAAWVREVVGERREIVVAMDWPEFDADELDRAIASYAGRERRFGRTSEQVRESDLARLEVAGR